MKAYHISPLVHRNRCRDKPHCIVLMLRTLTNCCQRRSIFEPFPVFLRNPYKNFVLDFLRKNTLSCSWRPLTAFLWTLFESSFGRRSKIQAAFMRTPLAIRTAEVCHLCVMPWVTLRLAVQLSEQIPVLPEAMPSLYPWPSASPSPLQVLLPLPNQSSCYNRKIFALQLQLYKV